MPELGRDAGRGLVDDDDEMLVPLTLDMNLPGKFAVLWGTFYLATIEIRGCTEEQFRSV